MHTIQSTLMNEKEKEMQTALGSMPLLEAPIYFLDMVIWGLNRGFHFQSIILDATLAEYHGWDDGKIGKAIPKMLERVKKWIADGQEVRIMTARASTKSPGDIKPIEDWLEENAIGGLTITNEKDFEMILLYDDRCVQIIKNTGERVDGKEL